MSETLVAAPPQDRLSRLLAERDRRRNLSTAPLPFTPPVTSGVAPVAAPEDRLTRLLGERERRRQLGVQAAPVAAPVAPQPVTPQAAAPTTPPITPVQGAPLVQDIWGRHPLRPPEPNLPSPEELAARPAPPPPVPPSETEVTAFVDKAVTYSVRGDEMPDVGLRTDPKFREFVRQHLAGQKQESPVGAGLSAGESAELIGRRVGGAALNLIPGVVEAVGHAGAGRSETGGVSRAPDAVAMRRLVESYYGNPDMTPGERRAAELQQRAGTGTNLIAGLGEMVPAVLQFAATRRLAGAPVAAGLMFDNTLGGLQAQNAAAGRPDTPLDILQAALTTGITVVGFNRALSAFKPLPAAAGMSKEAFQAAVKTAVMNNDLAALTRLVEPSAFKAILHSAVASGLTGASRQLVEGAGNALRVDEPFKPEKVAEAFAVWALFGLATTALGRATTARERAGYEAYRKSVWDMMQPKMREALLRESSIGQTPTAEPSQPPARGMLPTGVPPTPATVPVLQPVAPAPATEAAPAPAETPVQQVARKAAESRAARQAPVAVPPVEQPAAIQGEAGVAQPPAVSAQSGIPQFKMPMIENAASVKSTADAARAHEIAVIKDVFKVDDDGAERIFASYNGRGTSKVVDEAISRLSPLEKARVDLYEKQGTGFAFSPKYPASDVELIGTPTEAASAIVHAVWDITREQAGEVGDIHLFAVGAMLRGKELNLTKDTLTQEVIRIIGETHPDTVREVLRKIGGIAKDNNINLFGTGVDQGKLQPPAVSAQGEQAPAGAEQPAPTPAEGKEPGTMTLEDVELRNLQEMRDNARRDMSRLAIGGKAFKERRQSYFYAKKEIAKLEEARAKKELPKAGPGAKAAVAIEKEKKGAFIPVSRMEGKGIEYLNGDMQDEVVKDWHEGRLYEDGNGNWHIRPDYVPGWKRKSGKGPIARYNKELKQRGVTSEELQAAAEPLRTAEAKRKSEEDAARAEKEAADATQLASARGNWSDVAAEWEKWKSAHPEEAARYKGGPGVKVTPTQTENVGATQEAIQNIAERAKTPPDVMADFAPRELVKNEYGIPTGLAEERERMEGLKEGKAVLARFLREVPEAAIDPAFTVKGEGGDMRLVFKDGFTFEFLPKDLGFRPDQLKPGMKVGFDPEQVGVNQQKQISLAAKQAAAAASPTVRERIAAAAKKGREKKAPSSESAAPAPAEKAGETGKGVEVADVPFDLPKTPEKKPGLGEQLAREESGALTVSPKVAEVGRAVGKAAAETAKAATGGLRQAWRSLLRMPWHALENVPDDNPVASIRNWMGRWFGQPGYGQPKTWVVKRRKLAGQKAEAGFVAEDLARAYRKAAETAGIDPDADATHLAVESVLRGKEPVSRLPKPMQVWVEQARELLDAESKNAAEQFRKVGLDSLAATYEQNVGQYLKNMPLRYLKPTAQLRAFLAKLVGPRLSRAWGKFKRDAWAVKVNGKVTKYGTEEEARAAYRTAIEEKKLDLITKRGLGKEWSLTRSGVAFGKHPWSKTETGVGMDAQDLYRKAARQVELIEPIPEEWRLKNEIHNPVYLLAQSIMQTRNDAEVVRLFDYAAKKWGQDAPQGSQAEIDAWAEENGLARLPETGRLHNLAGRYVPKGIAEDLTELTAIPSIAAQIYRTYLTAWKSSKTIYNPATHARNVIGDFLFAHLAGTSVANPVNWPHYVRAIKALRERGERYRAAVREGFIGTEYYGSELKAIEDNLVKFNGDMSRLDQAIAAGLSVHKTVGRIYALEDQIFKMAAFEKYLEQGMTPSKAGEEVNKWFPNYERVGRITRLMRGLPVVGMPFASFVDQSVRIGARAASEHPLRLAVLLAIPGALSYAAALMLRMSPDEKELVDAERSYFEPLLPLRDGQGRVLSLDLRYIYPLANDVIPEERGGGALNVPWIMATPEGRSLLGVLSGRDTFTGKNIVPQKADTTEGEKWIARAKYLAASLLPAPTLATYGRERITKAAKGQSEEPLARALLGTILGVNVRTPYIAEQHVRQVAKNAVRDGDTALANRILKMWNETYKPGYKEKVEMKGIRQGAKQSDTAVRSRYIEEMGVAQLRNDKGEVSRIKTEYAKKHPSLKAIMDGEIAVEVEKLRRAGRRY